jgi:YHS domain-containing protein
MQETVVPTDLKTASQELSETYIDPVCRMRVTSETAAAKLEHAGETYYFCAVRCRDKFAADPSRFLTTETQRSGEEKVETAGGWDY